MEAQEITQMLDGTLRTTIYELHFSDEELKEFYLKEAILAHPLLYNHPHGELATLKQLEKDLKEICSIIDKINRLHWDEMGKCLQRVSGTYPAQNNISKKEHLEMNESLSEIWKLILLFSTGRKRMGQLYNHFNSHHANVRRLVKQYEVA